MRLVTLTPVNQTISRTRMHSSRMSTTRSSIRLLGVVCLSAYWNTSPWAWAWAWTPLWVWAWTPPGQTPNLPPKYGSRHSPGHTPDLPPEPGPRLCPSVDRQTRVKTQPLQTLFAGGNNHVTHCTGYLTLTVSSVALRPFAQVRFNVRYWLHCQSFLLELKSF